MGCRCSAIARCQNELNILSGTISSNINVAVNDSTEISQTLRQLANNIGESINTDTIYDVESLLASLNTQGNELSQALSGNCSNEIQRLSSLLQQMRSEDRAHHEAEEAAAAAAMNSK